MIIGGQLRKKISLVSPSGISKLFKAGILLRAQKLPITKLGAVSSPRNILKEMIIGVQLRRKNSLVSPSGISKLFKAEISFSARKLPIKKIRSRFDAPEHPQTADYRGAVTEKKFSRIAFWHFQIF